MNTPATAQAALRGAERLGRRHGKAAVYRQIGDSSSDDAKAFYRYLLRGIADADPQITDLYEMPDLTGRWDYDRDNLAADLGLTREDPLLAEAAGRYLAAARDEFWLEAGRLARRHLDPGPSQAPPAATRARQPGTSTAGQDSIRPGLTVSGDPGSSPDTPGGDRARPAPWHRPYPLPGPHRDDLLRYLHSSPHWEQDGTWHGAQVWQCTAASTRILVPGPGAPPRDDDETLLTLAACTLARVTLGIPPRGEWQAVTRLAAVTSLHREEQRGICACGRQHPCPTYLAATGEWPEKPRDNRSGNR